MPVIDAAYRSPRSTTPSLLWGKDEKSEAQIRFAIYGRADHCRRHVHINRFGCWQQPPTELAPVISLVEDVASNGKKTTAVTADTLPTKTPIKHLVVIFNENRSFDHYFGTYPNALNVEGEPVSSPPRPRRRDINNLLSSPALLDNNPNANPNVVPSNGATVTEPTNGANASNPFRIDRTQANTAGQNHTYTPEQLAYDDGKNDLFPLDTGNGTAGGAGAFGTKGQVMGYFDGNTVTAYWNYAQNYAMSDNAFTDDFGPSTPGAINMFAGTPTAR